MKKILIKAIALALAAVLLFVIISCQKEISRPATITESPVAKSIEPKELKDFVQINLVGNSTTDKPMNMDANLKNAWGITFPPSGPAWVSSEGNGLSTIYNLDGVTMGIPVSVPCAGNTGLGHPTGHMANPTPDFKLPNGNAASFIFATADGTIAGWNTGNAAVKVIDRSPSASYMGIAMAPDAGNFYIYAANFGQNKIDVYDKNWNQVNRSFVDPGLPSGFSPFNIQYLSDGNLFVLYAKKDASGRINTGQGNGIINIFNPNGTFIKRFATKGKLDTPWGITIAPSGFWGEWSTITNMILVGNYGDGHINVFDANGNYAGPLYTHGKALEIDGLWGLTFPPITSYNHYYLYFASGPNNGNGGLVGYIKSAFFN